ncbi:hypothetical protein LPJ61_003139 [Coemansia biformis]|uniref:RING-type domain-containing protein n=1 Tax=Coemansia biformis TaxID=1286918 RepID=A0A9W8CVT8_9FUNG|nr:hypothetical protein LPJ61_003139 [Coemansia biformis]
MSFDALPFPATTAELPETVARALRTLAGPLRDRSNTQYVPAPPLERGRYSACPTCGNTFGLFRRKHNCANCGLVVCADCLNSRWYLPKYGIKTPVPCCALCNRNLGMSILSSDELERCSIRELRGYLTVYGLYSPSAMIEKSDLIAAVYANSPMPQENEQHYRGCLPRPSQAAEPALAEQQQTRPRPQAQDAHGSAGGGGGGANSGSDMWDAMFAEIGSGIERGLEGIGQHLGSGASQHLRSNIGRGFHMPGNGSDASPPPSQRPQNTHDASRDAPSYSSHGQPQPQTYSHSQPRSRAQFRPQHPRPRSMQGDRSQGANASAAATAQASETTPSGATDPGPASTDSPDIKALVRDGTNPGTLSIKALKAVLAANYVDFSNLVEKHELVQRVQRLVDNTRLEMAGADTPRNDDEARQFEDNTCKICWDSTTNCVFLNCGHMCTCLECGNKILASARRECPICREYIAKVVHVFRA